LAIRQACDDYVVLADSSASVDVGVMAIGRGRVVQFVEHLLSRRQLDGARHPLLLRRGLAVDLRAVVREVGM
jgi:hypothetical protein